MPTTMTDPYIGADGQVKTDRTRVISDQEINRDVLLAKFDTAISGNDTFLTVASPTNAQVINQVQRLTKECTALLRLGRSDLQDTTAGT